MVGRIQIRDGPQVENRWEEYPRKHSRLLYVNVNSKINIKCASIRPIKTMHFLCKLCRPAGGTPSGDRVKSSDTKKKKRKLDRSYIHGKLILVISTM